MNGNEWKFNESKINQDKLKNRELSFNSEEGNMASHVMENEKTVKERENVCVHVCVCGCVCVGEDVCGCVLILNHELMGFWNAAAANGFAKSQTVSI